MTCLRHFGHLIQLCLDKKEAVTSQPWNPVDVETIFPLLGNITAISIRFINLSIPYEKVGTSSFLLINIFPWFCIAGSASWDYFITFFICSFV